MEALIPQGCLSYRNDEAPLKTWAEFSLLSLDKYSFQMTGR
jgi:hypothetical protein